MLRCMAFGMAGEYLANLRLYAPPAPSLTDKCGTFDVYPTNNAGEVTTTAQRQFIDDTKDHTKALSDFKKEERSMMAYIVSQITATAMVALNSDASFEGLLHRAESVPFIQLITKLLSGSTNAKMILHRMTKAFGIKMSTGTHEEYIELFRAALTDISADLGVVCKQVHNANPNLATSNMVNGETYIKLSDVASLIYLSGLDEALLRPKLDQLLLLHPNGRIPDTAAVIQEFQLFTNSAEY